MQTLLVYNIICGKNRRLHMSNADSVASGTEEETIRKYRLFNIYFWKRKKLLM